MQSESTQRPDPLYMDNRIHLLEVIGNSAIGGMENYLLNFISHLPADQFTVTCICPFQSSFTSGLKELGVEEVYVTPISDDPSWRSIQLTMEIAKLLHIDVLHAHMPKAHVLAGIAGNLLSKPVVATIHGMNVTSHELGITRAFNSFIITNCQESFTQALAMGIPHERLSLVRNGVDTEVFRRVPGASEIHEMLHLSSDTRLIGFIGRLEHEKGPDQFLRAAEIVHIEFPAVHFIIAGEGSMRGHLENMCRHMHLDQHVHFIGWLKNPVHFYSEIDILAHTSRSDGTSLVLLEAMACECPQVGIAVGGVREIIESDITGGLAGAGDWEEAGIKIIQLLQEPFRMKAMGEAARNRVLTSFDVSVNTNITAGILRSVAHSFRYKNYENNANSLSSNEPTVLQDSELLKKAVV